MHGKITDILVPIHREGWAFVTAFSVATLALGLLWEPLFFVGLVLTLWCAYFFRDPERTTPTREGLVISPADGVINMITKAAPPEELGMGTTPLVRVSVFMNVFDVHINRAPVAGRVKALDYRKGKFLNAALDKASVDNERQSYVMETDKGAQIAFVQIAGLVARRILCDVEIGDTLKVGERFGLIRFGSRVDVYLPEGIEPLVCEGQTAIAGETVLADLDPTQGVGEGARSGTTH